jgi:hypothetical protein
MKLTLLERLETNRFERSTRLIRARSLAWIDRCDETVGLATPAAWAGRFEEVLELVTPLLSSSNRLERTFARGAYDKAVVQIALREGPPR